MKKIVILLLCVVAATGSIAAQSVGTITGRLVNSSSAEAITGAVVEVSSLTRPSAAKRHVASEAQGSFEVRSLPYGRYKLSFTFIGYKTLEHEVTVGAATVAVGTLRMESETYDIGAVKFEVPAMRTSQAGDTISYNAEAFKVSADADTEGLLSKMPGITITDGVVEAQGEEVKKVFVDGKEFFGDDVSTAIKNLPAEVVEKVEVYNKLSDQAEFTGLDDGEGYKAINIVTAVDKRSGQFGKLYGAYGVPDKYVAGGNVNLFSGSSRVSLIGLVNNLNQQNFSFEDILGVTNAGGSSSGGGRMGMRGGGGVGGFMVRPMDGISTVQAFGVNYIDTWGAREQANVTASYFFNHSANDNESDVQRWQTIRDYTEYTDSYGKSSTDNYNHRFNARVDYKFSESSNLMLRPSFSIQDYNSSSTSRDAIQHIVDNVASDISRIDEVGNSNRLGYRTRLEALYRTRLGKPGRTLTINAEGGYSENNNDRYPEQYIFYPRATPPYYPDGAAPDSTGNQRIDSRSTEYELEGSATYTEPLGERSQLSLEYRADYEYSDADNLVYVWSEATQAILDTRDAELSNINNSGYLTQRVIPGYRYSDKKANISVSMSYQNALLDNAIELPARAVPEHSYSFDNLLYTAMANFNFDQQNMLRINVRSRTRNPSVSQLQDTPDLSDRIVRGGNPNLRPTYSNNFHAFYIRSNVAKGSTFNIGVFGSLTSDYIGEELTTYDAATPFEIPNSGGAFLGAGQQYYKPVNMGRSWSLRGRASYGFPVKLLASNLNFNAGVTFAQTPSIIDDTPYDTDERYLDGGLTLSSNISENLDFTLSYNGSFNVAATMAGTEKKTNRFVNHYASGNIKWVFWRGFTFTGNASWSQYRGVTDAYKEEYVLCNLYVGKKIFRNRMGEISVGVNDLFNQNTSFRRTVTGTYIQNSTNNTIGRYVAVQFIYNLRNFGKGATRDASKYEGIDSGSAPTGVQRSEPTRFGPPGMRR